MNTTTPGSVDLPTIVKQLRALCDEGATGTYYIVCTENRQVRIGFIAGELDALSIRAPDIKTAFDAIAKLNVARTAFARDGLAVTGGNLKLSTSDLFRELNSRIGQPVSTVQKTVAQVTALTQAQHKMIRKAFIEHLGPIGEFVYEEHQQGCSTLEALLTALANEIPDRRNGDRFITGVRAALMDAR
jgi:hypothetical protein